MDLLELLEQYFVLLPERWCSYRGLAYTEQIAQDEEMTGQQALNFHDIPFQACSKE